MSSAQVGKTELILNAIGYFVDYDPAPMLVLQPTLEMAQTFSKDRLSPMFRDTPALRGKLGEARAKDGAATILHKSFPGGHITMAGANSPASLASRPIRALLADEIDRYPVSAGTEGDPLALAVKRTTTFWNRKLVFVSTPTVAGASKIEAAFEDSTRERYCLPCPECGKFQPLRWANINFDLVGHACDECGAISSKPAWMAKPGQWIAEQHHPTTRGFHLNELISPWRSWSDVIDDFKAAKRSPERLKVFVNTSLGEPWQDDGEKVDEDQLYRRREFYPAEVPEGAVVLTAAVDVQADRLEVGVEGWGAGEENYKIDFQVIRGDPARPEVWRYLDDLLFGKRYLHESGVELSISCAVIDSGGHFTQQVYQYVKPREVRRVYAVKGKSTPGAPPVSRPTKSNLGGVTLFTLGVDTIKEVMFSRLKVGDPGPGFVHFPIDERFDPEYFAQLTAEKVVTRYTKGEARREWVKVRARNEALDIAVYNVAARIILNPSIEKIRERLVARAATDNNDRESSPTRRPRVKTNRGFVNSWR